MDYYLESLKMHEKNKGKISVESKVSVESYEDLSLAYTPGVSKPCLAIRDNEEDAYKYTSKGNMVAVVSDGSAVLGLGNIGGLASMPVMEGKAILFKEFGGVNAFPICLSTQSVDEIVNTVINIAPGFGGINLEDISAPRCFEVEKKLIEKLDIPVFHDDQHGTAIVTLAALINSLKVVNKDVSNVKVVINGAGAAGVAIAKLMDKFGVKEILLCDSKGIISKNRDDLSKYKIDILKLTNKNDISGNLEVALEDADVFVGVSVAGALKKEYIYTMAKHPIIFAMANPVPEIMPDEAIAAGAAIIGTGRSDFNNQINNVLVFPGIFKGALEIRAKKINEDMKIAAAVAIANIIDKDELDAEYIIPKIFDKRVVESVSQAVKDAALKTGENI
ncbi:NAD-dependent malic enzyme [Alkalibaculum sp. M08DMB]|uniref:NAD-dependent malic enzyme n=1 Tax=Alkalibaculum sporogenes TaxID=2655001 RepID=A0A6A7K939_9FIRM|nr:NADP-dependent malic enzyme [Alkalibaculum sporogenes]MPW25707.1 NAD-dependent malic enzyme [Alkalibaculum sporogenes]